MKHRAPEFGYFEGMAGRVLFGSLSLETLATGLALVAVAKTAERAALALGHPAVAPAVTAVLGALILARIALNGASGEWRGMLFSTAGGSLARGLGIAARFLILCALWFIPLKLFGWHLDEAARALTRFAIGPTALSPVVFVVLAMIASPPLLLIVAVGAERFPRILHPGCWHELFRGRLEHVVLVYVMYLGALGLVGALSLPAIVTLTLRSPHAGRIVGWAVAIFATGLSVDLLGRLCGFFVLAGRPEEPEGEEAPSPLPEEPEEPSRFTPVVGLVPEAGMEAAEPEPEFFPGSTDSGKPRLTGARRRVEDLVAWFGNEPDRALVEMEDLDSQHAPHPLVLHSLTLLYQRAGRDDRARETAGRAMRVCLDQGAAALAADLLENHGELVDISTLGVEDLLALAEYHRTREAPREAEALYRKALESAPEDLRTVKGLLRTAEDHLKRPGDPLRARAIYTLLLDHPGASPMAGFIAEGLAAAERRLAS